MPPTVISKQGGEYPSWSVRDITDHEKQIFLVHAFVGLGGDVCDVIYMLS